MINGEKRRNIKGKRYERGQNSREKLVNEDVTFPETTVDSEIQSKCIFRILNMFK